MRLCKKMEKRIQIRIEEFDCNRVTKTRSISLYDTNIEEVLTIIKQVMESNVNKGGQDG